MPSPFPGMDPYLEDPVLWPDFHERFITQFANDLNPRLPKNYVARVNVRVYVEQHDRDILPDVWIKRQGKTSRAPARAVLAVAGDPPWEISLDSDATEESFIAIRDVRQKSRVVTHIEVLSPANKTRGNPGYKLYRKKQREVLKSDVHLLEIDLLRQGKHTVSAPLRHLRRRGPWDYLVCLSRARRRKSWQLWPFDLPDRLPRILVPLSGNDPDVVVDLPRLFNRVYELGAYDRDINYRDQPPERMTGTEAQWLDRLLRKRGLRA